MEINNGVIKYQIEKIYLEISRAIAEGSFYKLYKKDGEPDDYEKENNIRFAAAAISIAFSFASLEAFCDRHLYVKFENQSGNWKINFRDKKYKTYFENESSMKRFLKTGSIEDKLKALASTCDKEPIHTVDPKLWMEITQISEDFRHFITHPNPDPNIFNQYMTKIMQKHAIGTYYLIAERTMSYFYEKPPEWLKTNVLFRFLKRGDFLPPKTE